MRHVIFFRGKVMSNANYVVMSIEGYRGNPLIEAIGWGLDESTFNDFYSPKTDNQTDVELIPENRRKFGIRSAIGRLKNSYIARDEAHAVYETMLMLMHQGYVNRNPLDEGYQKILTAIQRDMKDPLAAKHIKVTYGDSMMGADVSNGSSLLVGLSGDGKTTLITKALSLIERKIHHTSYVDQNGEEHKMDFAQQTHLYVKLNTRKGQKALLRSILSALDEDTGESYSFIYRNADVEELIVGVRKAMIIHGVGLLVIDEAQNFSAANDVMKIGANEKTSIPFVEEIFNRIGVPLFFVGTHSVLNLLTDVKTIRRVIESGGQIIAGCELGSPFWERFCQHLFRTEFLSSQTTDFETFKQHLHKKTLGVTAIAKSLVVSTLQYLTKVPPEFQDLGIDSINLVFKRQYSLLIPPLRALENEDYHLYEEYGVLAILKEIEEQEELEVKSDPSEDGQLALALKLAKRLKPEKAQKNLRKAKEVDVEIAEKLGVKRMMMITGGRDA